jgi:type II secretory pathway pseudopilin PulG
MMMGCTRQDRRRGQAGITLIELLVSMLIFTVIAAMMVGGWINLQRSAASAMQRNGATADGRDAIARISNEVRGAQPLVLPTGSPTATPMPTPAILTGATPWQADFYSSFNVANVAADGYGTTLLRPTRIYLDTAAPPLGDNPNSRRLYLWRDVDKDGLIDAGDRKFLLAKNVVNRYVNIPLFTYGYVGSSDEIIEVDNSLGTLDLTQVVSVQVRVIIDNNSRRAPSPIDMSTTVRLRNSSAQ